jgi:predicted DNA-binding antitoxin AbrB/MazE fold protein
METIVRAVFRNGVFVPTTACDVPENTEVEFFLQGPTIIPPSVTDPEERAQIRREVVERMRKNPLSADAPRFTREQLHERP